jgi:hypothetical protein
MIASPRPKCVLYRTIIFDPHLPSHFTVHGLLSSAAPSQGKPPCCGGVHVLYLHCFPSPHSTSHSVQLPHGLHTPSTGNIGTCILHSSYTCMDGYTKSVLTRTGSRVAVPLLFFSKAGAVAILSFELWSGVRTRSHATLCACSTRLGAGCKRSPR